MENLDNIEYEFYIRNNREYIDIENNIVNNYINSIVIVAKEGMNIKAKWEISKMPSEDPFLTKNIDPRTRDFKTFIPISIEENYKRYESSYTEEEKELLRNLLSKYFKLSEDKLNEIFGYKDKITEMINSMEPIKATEFVLHKVNKEEIGFYFRERNTSAKTPIVYDELINEMYSSSIINARAGEFDLSQTIQADDFFVLLDNLYGFNREDIYKYNSFFYSPKREELKEREYIILGIVDRVPGILDNFLYFAPIEYPKDSSLTVFQLIENYIYNTFYTVSEPIQRRFITFLQRYCNEKENKHVKTISYKQ